MPLHCRVDLAVIPQHICVLTDLDLYFCRFRSHSPGVAFLSCHSGSNYAVHRLGRNRTSAQQHDEATITVELKCTVIMQYDSVLGLREMSPVLSVTALGCR